MRRIIFGLVILGIATPVMADESVYNTVTKNTISQNSLSNATAPFNQKDWELNDAEWSKYQKLMSGQAGYYFKGYTPPEVLAMYSENEAELRHYSDIAVTIEHGIVEKQLKLNNAFHESVLRLYQDEPIIKPFDMTSFSPSHRYTPVNNQILQAGDHLAVFADVTKNDLPVEKLLDKVTVNQGVILDIYLVNVKSMNQIQEWAKENHIPVGLASSGTITLNEDGGRFARLSGSHQMPLIMLVRGGKSSIVNSGNL
jgi:integrating conjugative element protein (TIGR03759 family)